MVKLKCTHCEDIIEGDGKGTFISCKCGKIYVDETKYYWRIGGNKGDFEIIEDKKGESECMNYGQRKEE